MPSRIEAKLQQLQRSTHRTADLDATPQARLHDGHLPPPALRRAAAGHRRRHRAGTHPQNPRPPQQRSAAASAPSVRRATPESSRSVRRALICFRSPYPLRTAIPRFSFLQVIRAPIAPITVRSQIHRHPPTGHRRRRPLPTPASLPQAFAEKPPYPQYPRQTAEPDTPPTEDIDS